MRHKDGRWVWVEDRGRVVEWTDDGKPLRMVGTQQEITERKQNEAELEQHRHHLLQLVEERTEEAMQARVLAEAANVAKSSFIVNMSHEIRTPMNGILGMAELMRRDGVTPAQAARLDAIHAAGQDLLSVINDILDISRIESGKLILEDAPVYVQVIVGNVCSMLNERARAKGLVLEVDFQSMPLHLRGDPMRIRQALINYVTNAIKFSEADRAFFDNAGWVAWSAYFVGVAAIICSGIILKKTKMFAGEPAPFVMELPAYHWPTVGNVLRSMWERGWSFIKKAGTIILLSTIVLWFLMNFGWSNGTFGMLDFDGLEGAALEAAQAECVLAKVGSAIAWIFAPLGWTKAGNGWKMAVAAVSGLIAKENVVATFGQLFGFAKVAEDGSEIWKPLSLVMTPVAAYGFLVFNLLCAPCFAAMGAIKREMNNVKWFWFAIGYQCILAYIVSLCIYQIGTLITVGTFGVGTVVAFLLIIGFIYLLFRPYKESNTLNFDAKKTVSAK